MNILVNGSSITRGLESWPYQLQEITGCTLVNLALASSGYDYVFNSTVTEISQRRYDRVIVMWPESGRIDIRVGKPETYKDSSHTSEHQCQRNVKDGMLDEYVQRDWVFSFGPKTPGRSDLRSVDKLLQPFHQAISHPQILESELIKIISLQGILKEQGVPYTFLFWQPFKRFDRFEQYYNMIDWSNIYTDDYLETIVKRLGLVNPNDRHPTQAAHRVFAEQLHTWLDL